MHSWHLKHIRKTMIDDFLAEQKRQRDEFDTRLAAIDQRIKEAETSEDQNRRDPEVLVRSSNGVRRSVYHDADDPCGRTRFDGGKQQGFSKMRESEAKLLDRGILTRCPSCWKP